jgi:hypothetical protein
MISGARDEIREGPLTNSNYEIHSSLSELVLHVAEVPCSILGHRLAIHLRVFRAIGALCDTGPASDRPRTLALE